MAHTLVNLFVALLAAKVAGEVAERLKQPAVIGELLAGIALGPFALGWIRVDGALEALSTLGVVVLMFFVGLQTRRNEILKVGRSALLAGSLGIVLPLLGGYLFGSWAQMGWRESLFVGAALVATSVGITARVLADRGLIATRVARIIVAAAVVDDVLGLLVLSGVASASEGPVDAGRLALIGLEAVALIAGVVVVIPWLLTRAERWVDGMRVSHAPFVVALLTMLLFAALAEAAGLAAIVGAFFVGMSFADSPDRWELRAKTEPLYEFLVPFFFVAIGARVELPLLASSAVLVPGLVLAVIAIVTKVVGCGLAVLNEGPRRMLAVGVGMVPRGEVGLIVASMGAGLGIVTPPVYAMVVLVVALTTILVPPFLPLVFDWAEARADTGIAAIDAQDL